jgi:hypothetical protein
MEAGEGLLAKIEKRTMSGAKDPKKERETRLKIQWARLPIISVKDTGRTHGNRDLLA